MKEASFDVFSGSSDKDGIWLECVEGLSNARARMYEIAARKPGEYFVYSIATGEIVARAETSPTAEIPKITEPRDAHS